MGAPTVCGLAMEVPTHHVLTPLGCVLPLFFDHFSKCPKLFPCVTGYSSIPCAMRWKSECRGEAAPWEPAQECTTAELPQHLLRARRPCAVPSPAALGTGQPGL